MGESYSWQMEVVLPGGIHLERLGCDRRSYTDEGGDLVSINVVYFLETTHLDQHHSDDDSTRTMPSSVATLAQLRERYKVEEATCWPKVCFSELTGCCAGPLEQPYLPLRNATCVEFEDDDEEVGLGMWISMNTAALPPVYSVCLQSGLLGIPDHRNFLGTESNPVEVSSLPSP